MKKFLVYSLAVFCCACSTKQETAVPEAQLDDQARKPETSLFTEEESTMPAQPDYILKTLSNGLEVYMFPKSEVPVVTVLIAVKNGAYVQTPDIEGLAHLYEHMFFKANELIPSQAQFMKELDQMGIELGPNMNAYTSTESVRYFYTLQSQYLEKGLDFLANAVISPKFLQEELEKEREVVIGEFDRYESSPMQVFYQQDILEKLFTKYFARKNTIGSREIILNATPEQMKSIQKRFYVPNNSALFLVGDFDPEKAFADVEKYYSRWERGADPFVVDPIPAHPPLQESTTFIKRGPVQTANIVQAYQGPSLVENNQETIVFDLVGIMLGLESSAFQKELIHSGIASSAYFYSWSQRYTSPLFFSLETSPEKAQEAYNKFHNLIGRIAKGNFFSPEELKLAKASVEARSAYDREVGQRYALALASIWTSTDNLNYYTDYVQNMNKIQMSDIDSTLQKYLSTPFVLGALLPQEASALQLEGMKQGDGTL